MQKRRRPAAAPRSALISAKDSSSFERPVDMSPEDAAEQKAMQSIMAMQRPPRLPSALGARARRLQVLRRLIAGPRIAAGLCLGLAVLPAVGRADTYTVTNLQDGNNIAGSLRAALISANANPGADTITFSTGSGTVQLANGTLSISDSVAISVPSDSNIIIDANHNSAAIEIFNNNANGVPILDVSIQGLTVQNGNNSITGGGGIHSLGTNLALNGVTVRNCYGYGPGGGISVGNGTAAANPNVTISQSTFSGNTSSSRGGGIYVGAANPELLNNVVFGNRATTNGGGALLHGDAVVQQCDFFYNTAAQWGGGLAFYGQAAGDVAFATFSGNAAQLGGGIALYAATASIHETTVSGNIATTSGGGIDTYNAQLYLVNATVAYNQAPTGGGVFVGKGSTAFISFSTVASNSQGGMYFGADSNTLLDSSIVSGNGTDISTDPNAALNAQFNVVQSADSSGWTLNANNITGQDPSLGALANNGGDVQTMLPDAGSIAIAAANPDPTDLPATDARGVPRPNSGAADIGAVQLARCGSDIEGEPCTSCNNPCTACTCGSAGSCGGMPVPNDTACTGGTCQDGNCTPTSGTTGGGNTTAAGTTSGSSNTTGGTGATTGSSTTGNGSTTGGANTTSGGTTGTRSTPTTTTTGGTTTKKGGCAAAPVDGVATTLATLFVSWWSRRRKSNNLLRHIMR